MIKDASRLLEEYEYNEALEILNKVLSMDPINRDAKKLRNICEFMLKPTKISYPKTLLSETKKKRLGNIYSVGDEGIVLGKLPPKYKDLKKKLEKAKTPWDEKKLEHELTELIQNYNDKQFQTIEKAVDDEVDKITNSAVRKGKGKRKKMPILQEALSKLRETEMQNSLTKTAPDYVNSPAKENVQDLLEKLGLEKEAKTSLVPYIRKAKLLINKYRKNPMKNEGVLRSLKFELKLLERKYCTEWIPTYGELYKSWAEEADSISTKRTITKRRKNNNKEKK